MSTFWKKMTKKLSFLARDTALCLVFIVAKKFQGRSAKKWRIRTKRPFKSEGVESLKKGISAPTPYIC